MALLGRAVGRGVLAAQLGGALLFAVVIAVEAADEPLPTLLRTIGARLPTLWAQAASVLALCGAALAVARLRRQGVLLGLGTLGATPRMVLLVGALAGALVGGVASRVVTAPSDVPGAWERGDGGWIRDDEGWPDAQAGAAGVRARPAPHRDLPTDVLNAGAAGALGAALGLYAGAAPALVAAAVLLVADVVARGLSERGVLPFYGGAAPAALAGLTLLGLLLRAPLFPKRWG
ncbi:MAG: hypothetical protein Q8P18_02310 [Pseudomonadota bacterium]|nr:hypothetical protein [Pseudomonadota bacterium]